MLLNSNFYYHIHKRSHLAPVLGQINPSPIFRHLLQINFNTIYPLGLPFLALFFKFSHQRFVCTVFLRACYITCPSRRPWSQVKLSLKKSWTSSSWSFLQHFITASVISPYILPSTLFSGTLCFPASFTW